MSEFLEELREKLESYLDSNDKIREEIIKLSRKAIRHSATTIKQLHKNNLELAKKELAEVEKVLAKFNSLKEKNLVINPNMLFVPYQEYTEACLFYAYKTKKKFTDPFELNIPVIPYLHGIADLIGELRRYALDSMRERNFDDSVETLSFMEELYLLLLSFDYPDGLTAGLRRKTDLGRKLVERTRGELTLALVQEDQINRIQELLGYKNKK